MSLFRRKQPAATKEEPSLLDIDDNTSPNSAISPTTENARRTGFLGAWNKKIENTPQGSDRGSTNNSPKLAPPMQPNSASPRISTSSRASVFERSVDASVLTHSGANGTDSNRLVDPNHAQLIVDNQIPSVLDASVEAITSNENLDHVEVITAQPTLSSDNLSVPNLPNPWSEEENISTAHVPSDTGALGAAKRLSFVSYADLLGVEHAEAEAASLRSSSPKPLSPDATGQSPGTVSPLRPGSTPIDPHARRAKSIVSLSVPGDLELTRTSMAETILQPSLPVENDNPWA